MNKTATISQLLNTPDGTYINASVTGYLTGIRPPNGKGPSKAKLSDGSHQIEVSLWGGGVTQWEGQQVTFSGKGMKIQEYKGTKSLSVGDKVNIGAADVNPDLEAAPAIKPASLTIGRVPTSQPAPSNLPVNLPHGAAVGGAVARAVEIWRHIRPAGSGAIPDQQDMEDIETIARRVCEIQGKLERGEPMTSGEPF